MPLTVRRTGEKIRVEAPLWAAGMAEASREWLGFRMAVWRASAGLPQSRCRVSRLKVLSAEQPERER